MTMIRRTFTVPASADDVWDVFRDIGGVHTRLAPGFVIDTEVVSDDVRRVTFANGAIVTEQIVSLDDENRRPTQSSSVRPSITTRRSTRDRRRTEFCSHMLSATIRGLSRRP